MYPIHLQLWVWVFSNGTSSRSLNNSFNNSGTSCSTYTSNFGVNPRYLFLFIFHLVFMFLFFDFFLFVYFFFVNLNHYHRYRNKQSKILLSSQIGFVLIFSFSQQKNLKRSKTKLYSPMYDQETYQKSSCSRSGWGHFGRFLRFH